MPSLAVTFKYSTSDVVYIFNEKGQVESTTVREGIIRGAIGALFDADTDISYSLNAIDDEGVFLERIQEVVFATEAEAVAYVQAEIP